jgi:hypothetical protein
MSARTNRDGDRLLRIYLQDHLAGANAGVALVRRSREANQDTHVGEVLAGIEQQIVEDREVLIGIMSRLGVGASPIKSALGVVTELVGRLKSNGRLVRYSPSSRVVELEVLAAGVITKRSLWRALRAIAEGRPELDSEQLDELVERATDQFDRIVAIHPQCAHEAFATVSETPSSEANV